MISHLRRFSDMNTQTTTISENEKVNGRCSPPNYGNFLMGRQSRQQEKTNFMAMLGLGLVTEEGEIVVPQPTVHELRLKQLREEARRDNFKPDSIEMRIREQGLLPKGCVDLEMLTKA